MSSCLWALTTLALALSSTIASAQTQLDVPIMAGGRAEHDACGGYGEIANLKPPDDYLSVRSGPAARHREIDRLRNGSKVFVCDEKAAWVGIVYSATRNRDCNVGGVWPKRRAYNGPCKRGWIHGKFLKMLAG